ncbi:murein hydrolase activator EnvC family protein [Jannaschia sp. LMIT008]|uniref:murein hydrolase activator EnvC family protein n=1 Tax=Jannaschia maritima TaxID=3032585 RepID=UPI0028124294|nr:peptidoglycan DD-metalloendopeptidase family protein [Jannaschia sp. LMIT008]
MPVRLILAVLLLWIGAAVLPAPAVRAQGSDDVRAASAAIGRAGALLAEARTAPDRIRALGEAVRAYEDGLAALRADLRRIDLSRRALAGDLAVRDDRVASLLGALAALDRAPDPVLLLHPDGALGTARAAMLLGHAAPALDARAAALRADVARLSTLRALEDAAVADLTEGLAGVQAARAALSRAVSDRTDLPPRLADDARLDDLLARAANLADFADGLGALPAAPGNAALPDRPVPLPLDAVLLRPFGATDAAGVTRPGLVLAAAPGALLQSPLTGTVRHAGPLLDYGIVIVLEPAAGALVVLAGLGEAYVARGDVVAPGDPLGAMGGSPGGAGDFRQAATAGGGVPRTETLYVEVRTGGRSVDPAGWFAVEQG